MRGDLKWHGYNHRKKSVKLMDLVAEIKSDPYGFFGGNPYKNSVNIN